MNNEQILRIKSAMIIYSLERALGNFVINSDLKESFSEGNISAITKRNNETSGIRENISLLIESSYLDEVFNFAIDVTRETRLEDKMKSLKSLCLTLNIFDIRNAISHPNRPFPDTFWFRSASIASDPLILQLGLGEVRQALNSALSENLSPPPDEWINDVKWAIPNTLPESFDHEITGLLGRDSEFKDLELTLSTQRVSLIAIVAPGGVGKTSLILQFLKEMSLDHKWSSKISAIIFCTLKNERLTPDGIEKIEAINGIEQIKISILNDLGKIYSDRSFLSFEDAVNQLENEKILLCIDNLETLLVHTQREFLDFNKTLPLFWKVIVTSRILLDSASTVSIQPLGKRYAISLCRIYFKRRGVNNFKLEDLELISVKSNYNPLAIRLTVDLYLKGIDIKDSITKSQQDIAAFSYNNLIESLREYSIWILEAIYVLGQVNKSQLLDLLELSNEDISDSINELSRTSLLIRDTSETGNDSFKLSDSIKDLLLINPINIGVRNKISEKIKERKIKIQDQLNRNQVLGINEFDVYYISDNLTDSIRALAIDLNKALNKPLHKRSIPDIVKLKQRFSEYISYDSNNHEVLFHYSRVLKALRDEIGEAQIIEELIRLECENPRYLLAKGINLYSKKELLNANEIFESLVKRGYSDPSVSSKKYAGSLIKLNFLCLLELGNYQEILIRTENWHQFDDFKIQYGTYRSTALKRSVEHKKIAYADREKIFSEIILIFTQIFEGQIYLEFSCVEVLKFIKDISSMPLRNFTEGFLLKFISFVKDHFFDILGQVKGQAIDSVENRELILSLLNYEFEEKENPLVSAKWLVLDKKLQFDNDHVEELIKDGYTIVKVVNIPDNNFEVSSYLFARDNNENSYFLHVDNFQSGWNRWGYIGLNDLLGVKYDKLSNDKSTVPWEIVEIDKIEF